MQYFGPTDPGVVLPRRFARERGCWLSNWGTPPRTAAEQRGIPPEQLATPPRTAAEHVGVAGER